MAVIAAYLVAATLAVAVALALAGPRRRVARDPTLELKDVANRHVGILGALSGFAVTGIVFLVTQSRNVPDPTGTPFTTVLAMFVVGYMGYFSSSLLYANISQAADDPAFDLAAAQYASASTSLFAVLFGWFALKPLFETFGLTAIAALTGWFLLGAVIVSYGFLASALHRSGFVAGRLLVAMPALAMAGAAAYALVVAAVPGLRTATTTLELTVIAFALGIPAYATLTVLPVLARDERRAAVLGERWHLAVVMYAQSVIVLITFLLLAVIGVI